MDTLAYIENSISIATWSTLSPYLQIVKKFPKRPTVFTIDRETFGKIFGDEFWYCRILNEAGDIAKINFGTLQIVVFNKKPLIDYREVAGRLVKIQRLEESICKYFN